MVPPDPLLQDADGHGGDGHHGELGEPTEGQRAEGTGQRRQAECRLERQADDGGTEEDAEEREDAGDDPRHRLQVSHRNAEHRGPVPSIPSGAGGDAELTPPRPHGHSHQGGDGHDHADDVIGREHQGVGADRQVPRERDMHRPDGRRSPDEGDEQADHQERLRDPDGDHREQQAWGTCEPPDEHDLDHSRDHDGRHQPGGQPHQVADTGEPDEPECEDGGCAPQIALGEVDDPVEAEDEGEPHRHQRTEQTEDGALDPHRRRHGEEHELGDEDGDDRQEPSDRGDDGAGAAPPEEGDRTEPAVVLRFRPRRRRDLWWNLGGGEGHRWRVSG